MYTYRLYTKCTLPETHEADKELQYKYMYRPVISNCFVNSENLRLRILRKNCENYNKSKLRQDCVNHIFKQSALMFFLLTDAT